MYQDVRPTPEQNIVRGIALGVGITILVLCAFKKQVFHRTGMSLQGRRLR
ncbi:MAG: hypothetical protein ACR2JW_03380 [Thermomicrobiales bacterium]